MELMIFEIQNKFNITNYTYYYTFVDQKNNYT